MRNYLQILIFFFLISCITAEKKADLNQALEQLNKKDLFNGAIIVTENDSFIISKGFGYSNFKLKQPFETDTPMDTGSITKTFTALAMVMLADSIQIDLNTPVHHFIQEFPYKFITINHLLQQTSGIVSDDYVFDRAQKGETLTNEIFLKSLIKNVPELEFRPGSQFQYNGFNHILIAILIERISKVSYEEYIKKKIADPLNLNDWFLRPTRLYDFPKQRAIGYSLKNDSIRVDDSDDYEGFYGDCNLFFSAEDLSKWSNSFISSSLYPEEKLSHALNMKSTLSDFNLLHWYSLNNHSKYHFTGDWKGFYSMVYFDTKKKRSITYLSNSNISYWMRPKIVRNINNFLDNGDFPDWIKPNPFEINQEEITGSYLLNKSQDIKIISSTEGLVINMNNKDFELFELDQNFYYVPGIDLWLWFTKDENENLKIHCSSIYSLKTGLKITAANYILNNIAKKLTILITPLVKTKNKCWRKETKLYYGYIFYTKTLNEIPKPKSQNIVS